MKTTVKMIVPLRGGNVFLDDAVVALFEANPLAIGVRLSFMVGDQAVSFLECHILEGGERRSLRRVAASVMNMASAASFPVWDRVEISAVESDEGEVPNDAA